MATKKQQCPEFPYFGANYPDATCIDGYLYDLDNCDENGNLYEPSEKIPCPFCNKEEYFEKYGVMDEEEDSVAMDEYKSIVAWVRKHYPDYIIED